MDDLTDGQAHALRNLAEKQTGGVTAFINIADAQRLTELGLACRSRQGWDITPEGLARLSLMAPPSDDAPNPVTDLHLVRGGESNGDAK